MKLWKYKIIEYEYKSIVYEDGKMKIECAKTLHKTNSKLLFYLILLVLKISGIKYKTIVRD